MKKTSTLIMTLLLSASVFAGVNQVKVIYGDDNRVDVIDSTDNMFIELSKSTAGMIDSDNLSRARGGMVTVTGKSLEARGMCASERFAEQTTAASCSGFLVGEKHLVTAGHCITGKSACKNYRWVFDYKIAKKGDKKVKVSEKSIYKCSKIVARELVRFGTKDDWALIELDRKVTDREPLEFRKTGKIKKGDDLVVIGHPSGLPTKIADGSTVRSLTSHYFRADLDTYGGNSGSAVFNATTGVVEGILVRGERDYVTSNGCRASNTIGQDEGRGEDVTYITNIKELLDI